LIRAHAALLTAVLLLLAACTPPVDVSILPPDDTAEQVDPPHVDDSPLAADRHKDPNAPQKIEWQRERMLHHQGYYYFWQDETISPASINDIPIELGQIKSTTPRTAVPIDNLQTNFGFVGYTVYRNEEHPEYFYIMDNGTFHVLYSPQRANKGYNMPDYLRYNSTIFVTDNIVRELPVPDYYANFTEVGTIQAEVDAEQIPYDDLTTNCGHVGAKVYMDKSAIDGGYILLEDGYIELIFPYMATPHIRYKGALYYADNKGSSVISDTYQKVGAIVGVVPGNVIATENFYCNTGYIGCEIYAGQLSGTIYVLYDGIYWTYNLPNF
jgi:hypothetical protein